MAFGIDDAIANGAKLIDDAINKIWPDPQAKASAEATMIKAAADAAISQLQAAQAVMLAEASSDDKWTSRARPSFLYVVYVVILCGLPMGVLYAVNGALADAVAQGFKAWLDAIPQAMWDLFLYGYLGYAVARTGEKSGGILPFITGKKGS